MTQFALIPAKSRSTRLPHKNMLPVAGKPMVFHVIEHLRDAQLFDEIWVSTDSEEMAEQCKAYPVNIHLRSADLALDHSTVNDVCLDWLSELRVKPALFCCTYATSIFLTPQDYQDARACLKEPFDGVMGVSEFNYPPVQALKQDNDGQLSLLMPEYEKVQSQYHPQCYVSNGSQYWVKTTQYLKQKTFYLNRLAAYVTNEDHILDINIPEDYQAAIERAKMLGW